METNKKLVIIAGVVVAMVVAALVYWNLRQHSQMQEMVEQLEFEKEELADEYEDLAIQFDGYQQMDIQNDSLQDRLAQEQQRVRDLLEELRITKVTDARRIAALKKELATVRAVMVGYVRQIDSLNQTNQRLTAENLQYRRQNEEITQANTQLSDANTQLTKVVTRAAMLEVGDFAMLPLNKRDRKTSLFNQIQKLQFSYTIRKNITCEPGEKIVYLSIRRPDGEVMQKSQDHLFKYENGMIPYSVKQAVEYAGEDLNSVMYWRVEEILQQGIYTADFFIDGNLCGSFSFELRK
ncbi:MAG: hypothetical protein MJZ75_01335 [Paludibacteraceae bacterium]|nr:hypothetical protein [Paludibacteraceae bacterium]